MILIAAVFLAGISITQASSSLFGGATSGTDHVILVSDLSNNPATTTDDYSGITFNDAVGVAFTSLTNLSASYNVTDDDCGGGSPRFQIQVDTNGDSVSDGNVMVAFGPSPNFTNCALSWQSTGNVIGNNDAGRYDFSAFGGSPFTTYSNAPASVSSGTVRNISIVVDSGWSNDATNGDSEQTVLIDNVVINNATYAFDPAPVTVTIVKMIDGSHASSTSATSSFPMASSWSSTSTGSGSGTFALGPTGFNNPSPYEATTADMTSGASYSTNEVTSTSTGAVVGADCTTGAQYRLLGYTSGDSRQAAASSTLSTTTPSFTNITTNKYVYVWNASCAPAAATTSTVTIVKYVDGAHATASSSNSAVFPMQANYQASNVIGGNPGTDPYSIGPVGNNTPNAYEAKTLDLANGASYSTYEHTNTPVVGASCVGTTTPFRLVGYSTGDTLQGAASSTVSTSTPSFTNLQSNKYVIVWNATCQGTSTPPTSTSTVQVHILKYLDGSKATAASSSNFMFPMTSTWNAANLNGGATTSGSYVLGNNHGGAADQYGADTAAMNQGANYSTSEVTSTSSGMILPIGAACETNKYKLLGYKTSNISFADAATQSLVSATPTFWSLNSDRFVIVYNQTCNGSQTPPPSVSNCAASSTPSGYQRVNGTAGNDTVTLAPNTYYVGMGGNDKVTGGNGNYVICTGPGNDTIKLGNGNAQIDAGGGNNTITTGDGTHSITTMTGNDKITTGNGVDTVNAGGGNNNITHGDGVATIMTGGGNDKITTGNGNKNVSAGGGNDNITTGSGTDVIDAGSGNNAVKSGGGDDSITAGSGNDNLNGEIGTDTCVAGGGNNAVTNCEL